MLVSVSYDETCRITNVGSGKVVHVIDCFKCPVLSVVASNGMAYVGDTFGKIRQIDIKSGKVVKTWPAHKGHVESLAISKA